MVGKEGGMVGGGGTVIEEGRIAGDEEWLEKKGEWLPMEKGAWLEMQKNEKESSKLSCTLASAFLDVSASKTRPSPRFLVP